MSKYYIGGVATVSAFVPDSTGAIKHFFDAKTLTDSSINVSVSNEEIRGGEGAQLLGKFFHTTVFNLSLTDALFDLKYIATQVGSDIGQNGLTSIMRSYTLDDTTHQIKTDTEVAPLQFGSMYTASLIGWDTDGNTYTLEGSGTTYTVQLPSGITTYPDCVTVAIKQYGDQVQVNAMYTPGVMSLIMRAKLFAGDSCKASDGKAVGEVVIEIPKFQLDGTIDLAMAMTSPATYALNGSALANGCGCDDDMWYARITDVIYLTSSDEFYGYTGIVIDGNYLSVGDTLGVYAFATGKSPKALAPAQYVVTGNGTINATTGAITGAGDITVTANIANSAINGKTDAATTVA